MILYKKENTERLPSLELIFCYVNGLFSRYLDFCILLNQLLCIRSCSFNHFFRILGCIEMKFSQKICHLCQLFPIRKVWFWWNGNIINTIFFFFQQMMFSAHLKFLMHTLKKVKNPQTRYNWFLINSGWREIKKCINIRPSPSNHVKYFLKT